MRGDALFQWKSIWIVVVGLLLASTEDALALPSFADQTGEPCGACHVGSFGPALTPFGRDFKASGFGATSSWQVASSARTIPITGQIFEAHFAEHKSVGDTGGDNSAFSDNHWQTLIGELALAGKYFDNVGGYLAVNWESQDFHVKPGHMDLRAAGETRFLERDTTYGFSINDNPTISDIYNSTPVWSSPSPAPNFGTPLIAGAENDATNGIQNRVVGFVPYAKVGNDFYAEVGGYVSPPSGYLRTTNLNTLTSIFGTKTYGAGANPVIDGIAPYWRFSVGHDFNKIQNFEVGTFGMATSLQPDPSSTRTDKYQDYGLTGTYQYIPKNGPQVAITSTYIHEDRHFDASYKSGNFFSTTNRRDGVVDDFNMEAKLVLGKHYELGVIRFDRWGSPDSGLYADKYTVCSFPGCTVPLANISSKKNVPDTSGFNFHFYWIPFGQEDSWGAPYANLRLGIAYTAYQKYLGSTYNYDGKGRNASDNNTVQFWIWTAF